MRRTIVVLFRNIENLGDVDDLTDLVHSIKNSILKPDEVWMSITYKNDYEINLDTLKEMLYPIKHKVLTFSNYMFKYNQFRRLILNARVSDILIFIESRDIYDDVIGRVVNKFDNNDKLEIVNIEPELCAVKGCVIRDFLDTFTARNGNNYFYLQDLYFKNYINNRCKYSKNNVLEL